MDYGKAEGIRKKGLAGLITDNLVEGKGIGSSFGSAISDRTKATFVGIQEKFDPLNIAKKLTGGSNLAPALLGRLMGRKQSTLEHFAKPKRKSSSRGGLGSSLKNGYVPGDENATEVLGMIYEELKLADEERKNLYKARKKEEQNVEEREIERNKAIIAALTGRKKKEESERKKTKAKKGEEGLTAPPKGAPPKAPKGPKAEPKAPTGPTAAPKAPASPAATPKAPTKPKAEPKAPTGPTPKTATPTKPTSIIPSGVAKGAGVGAVAIAGALTISKIIEVGKGYNVVQLSTGEIVRREGAWNWRNNNPGNIEYGDYALSKGAIPYEHGMNKPQKPEERFAVFPNYETGRQAKSGLIFEGKNYKDLNLDSAIARYAPPKENDTQAYQAAVKKALGLPQEKLQTMTMKDFNQEQRNLILSAMEKQEGYGSGKKQTYVIQKGPENVSPANISSQVDSTSKENKDLKSNLNNLKNEQKILNNTNINQTTHTPAPQKRTPENDRPAILEKSRG